MPCASTSGRPVDSSAKFAPPPVIPRTASTTSTSRLLITCVAPSSLASSSRDVTTSMAMMVVAPATRAAITALRPTAPAPKLAKLLPAVTLSELITAPAPVWMPQPSGPSSSIGASSGTLIALFSRLSA